MKIQGMDFKNGELVIYADYGRSAHAGAGGCFQVVDIRLDKNSLLGKLNIEQGHHYFNKSEIARDLKVELNEINIIEV